jgi:hypothetical protein
MENGGFRTGWRADSYLNSLGYSCIARTAEQACKTPVPRSRQCGKDDAVAYVEGALSWTPSQPSRALAWIEGWLRARGLGNTG